MKNIPLANSLNLSAQYCLMLTDPHEKVQQTHLTRVKWLQSELNITHDHQINPKCLVGIPETPLLVPFHKLPKRAVGGAKGHAALIHAFAHIEFNAVNIAWDAVYRFPNMPDKYYDDWSKVADEEAFHFTLLQEYLLALGYDYGSFNAHQSLWEMVEQTSNDVLVRMALIPRVLEARGLDVTPNMIKKFEHHGHKRAAEILQIIYRDEIGHVEIGSYWFNYLCKERNLNPEETFSSLIEKYAADKIKKPINNIARLQAGFSEKELENINLCAK